MEAVMVIATVMQVVGSISAGYQQAAALDQQASMFRKQAQIYGAQMIVDDTENDRRVALEEAATAQDSLDRTQRLRRIIGATVAQGAAAGIGTQYGSITSLNEYSQSQAGAEDAIAQDNSRNRIISLNLNNAINQQNLANKAVGAEFQAGQLNTQADQAVTAGWMKAAGSVMNYGMDQYNRGSVPSSSYNSATGSNGASFSQFDDNVVVRWK